MNEFEIRDMPRLVRGRGRPGRGACWMSTLNWMSGADRWTDEAECVDPTIRGLCIRLNDELSDEEREEVIGPHLFEPYGTAQGWEWTERRFVVVVRCAVTVWAADALRAVGLDRQAEILRRTPVESGADFSAARAAARSAAYDADAHAAYAAYAARAARAAAYASYVANAACANDAASAAYAAYAGDASRSVLDLILHLCAMGREEREDVEPARDLAGLCAIVPRASST